jgi:hypothetical protein
MTTPGLALPKKTEYEYEDEFEYDWGNEKERGGPRAIAESVFLSREFVRV